MIHTPTFDPFSTNLGLILAMCCIGAVYSDSLSPETVRWLVNIVHPCVLRSSQVYKLAHNPQQRIDLNHGLSTATEELLALGLFHSLLLWHGSPTQRQQAREDFWTIATAARRVGLLQPLPQDNPNASALHQPGPVTGDEVNSWSWASWLENEKRSRLMTFIFLFDSCSTIYFNNKAQFDVFEIMVPLPADDAAWEARTAEECASALGLRGEQAQVGNISGSRRAKQLGMSEALGVLYGASQGHFPTRATNVYGKFSKFCALPDILRMMLTQPQSSYMPSLSIFVAFSSRSIGEGLQAAQAHSNRKPALQVPQRATSTTRLYNSAQQSALSKYGRRAGMQTSQFSSRRINVGVGFAETEFISSSSHNCSSGNRDLRIGRPRRILAANIVSTF